MKKQLLAFLSLFVCCKVALFGQDCEALKKFNDIYLPFETNEGSFDLYAADEPAVFTEDEIKCLCKKDDDFWARKSLYPLVNNNYYEYFSVGRFSLFDGVDGFLFYRDYRTKNGYYIELVLSIIDSKSQKILLSFPISIYNGINNYYSSAKIYKDGNQINVIMFDDKAETLYCITRDELGQICIKKSEESPPHRVNNLDPADVPPDPADPDPAGVH